jgi:hypothetical protein
VVVVVVSNLQFVVAEPELVNYYLVNVNPVVPFVVADSQ